MYKIWIILIGVFIGGSAHALNCSKSTLEGGGNNWLTANGWMGTNPPPVNSGTDLSFQFKLPPGRRARLERNVNCTEGWGPVANTTFTTAAQSIQLTLSSDTSIIAKFRLWDDQGRFLEWPLAGIDYKGKTFSLSIPQPNKLNKINGFHIEVENSIDTPTWSLAPATDINITVNTLNFSTAAVTGLSPNTIPALASIDQPVTNTANMLPGQNERPQMIFFSSEISAILKFGSACGANELRNLQGDTKDNPLADTCISSDVQQALAYAKLAYSRLCVDKSACTAALSFGSDGFRAGRTADEWKDYWTRIKMRLDGIKAKLEVERIPFYLHIGGNALDILNPIEELGINFMASDMVLGFYLGETTWEAATDGLPSNAVGHLSMQDALGNLLDYVGDKRFTGRKALVHHRGIGDWWSFELIPEGMAIFNDQPPEKQSSLKNHREVYVPAWEILEPSALSLNMASVQGLWTGGWIDRFGVSTQSWGWENMRWGTTHDMRALDWLRMWTMSVGTGASILQIEPSWAFASYCAMDEIEQQTYAKLGLLLNICESSRIELFREKIQALHTFNNWIQRGVVIAAKKPSSLLSLSNINLQINSPDHKDFDSTRMNNRRPPQDRCFSLAELNAKPDFVANSIPESCKYNSCDRAACNNALATLGDHEPALINHQSNWNYIERSRLLPEEDIFAKIYGNSNIYDGFLPTTEFGLLPILGVGTPPSGVVPKQFSGANINNCGSGGASWCGSVKAAADQLMFTKNSVSSPNNNIRVLKGGALVIQADGAVGGIPRYVAYLYDNELRFPKGATVALELAGPLAISTITDAVTGQVFNGPSNEVKNLYVDLREPFWTHSTLKRRIYVDVPPAGVKILNIVLATRPPILQQPGSPYKTAQLWNSDNTSDGSSVADWDKYYYKATCGTNYAMTGISLNTTSRRLNRQLCTFAPSLGGNVAVLTSAKSDSFRAERTFPGMTSLMDWDSGAVKWQCGANEFVSGISQSTSTPAVHGIRCTKGLGQLAQCEVRKVTSGDDRGNFRSGDWSPYDYKAECSAGKVVVGVSHNYATGTLSSILCCDG